MDKFHRNYLLTVQLTDRSFQVIEPPFTLEFNTNKNNFGSGNDGSFTVYGLSQQLRSLIRLDATDYNTLRFISLQVGYGNKLSTIFNGNITNAYSVREGDIFKTHIRCTEGGFMFANGRALFTFPQGVTREQIISTIIDDMSAYGVNRGAIGKFPGSIARGNSYDGNHGKILSELTGGGFSVQEGRAYCLGDGEFIPGVVDTINASSGLLNTPERETTNVNIETLLEPDVKMLQGINLVSSTGDNVNGFYKVIALSHSGIISPVVCGSATTKIKLSPVALQKVIPS